MSDIQKVVVTGAFSFSGRYITRKLLDAGLEVSSLTNHPRPELFEDKVRSFPLDFGDFNGLVSALRGAQVLVNTYWIRFPYGNMSFEKAVENSVTLFRAACEAGVKRIVHTSIANPYQGRGLGYYEGKISVEEALQKTGLSYAILRPTVLFGPEDVLINNIAWFVRRLPVFAVPWRYDCLMQPIYVGDFADLAVEAVCSEQDVILDAAGPETFSFAGLVKEIGTALEKAVWVVRMPALFIYLATLLAGLVVDDVVLTWAELQGLSRDLLVSSRKPRGTTELSSWMREHSEQLGMRYASELARHYR